MNIHLLRSILTASCKIAGCTERQVYKKRKLPKVGMAKLLFFAITRNIQYSQIEAMTYLDLSKGMGFYLKRKLELYEKDKQFQEMLIKTQELYLKLN